MPVHPRVGSARFAIEIRVCAKKRRGELVLDLKNAGLLKDGPKANLSSGNDKLTLDGGY